MGTVLSSRPPAYGTEFISAPTLPYGDAAKIVVILTQQSLFGGFWSARLVVFA